LSMNITVSEMILFLYSYNINYFKKDKREP
jgi:hypothetical protein